MYDHTLHRGRKCFCYYFLEAFRTAGKLKCHVKECFKIMVNKELKPKKGDSKIMKEK